MKSMIYVYIYIYNYLVGGVFHSKNIYIYIYESLSDFLHVSTQLFHWFRMEKSELDVN